MNDAYIRSIATIARSAFGAATSRGASEQAAYRAAAGAIIGVLCKEGEALEPWKVAVLGQVEMRERPDLERWHAFSQGVVDYFSKKHP